MLEMNDKGYVMLSCDYGTQIGDLFVERFNLFLLGRDLFASIFTQCLQNMDLKFHHLCKPAQTVSTMCIDGLGDGHIERDGGR